MDLVCFSQFRWDYVYQRPQHLLTRLATNYRVFYIEEPLFHDGDDRCEVTLTQSNIWRVIPMLSAHKSERNKISRQRSLLNSLFSVMNINEYIFWYYSPMALKFTDHFSPVKIIYDCVDEFSAQNNFDLVSKSIEKKLLNKSDVVFAAGTSLYNKKKEQHKNVHLIPGSIDKDHFAKSRLQLIDPPDQVGIPHPRIGFFGVIDEKFDCELLKEVAEARPDWHFILIGPLLKVNRADLPDRKNIHYLGGKSYNILPKYLSRWDIAMIPLKVNETTSYKNPIKTAEYLAGGKPVVSTSIPDVVKLFGEKKLVRIVNTPYQFVNAVEHQLHGKDKKLWLKNVDEQLSTTSWDKTFARVLKLINAVTQPKMSVYNTPALQNNNRSLILSSSV